MNKVRLATVWLDACSGCHMSLLDTDEAILDLLSTRAELVSSPLVDSKTDPEDVDVYLISGAVSTQEDMEKVRRIRRCARLLVSLGDCAVTGNVPAMRNPFGVRATLEQAYQQDAEGDALPGTSLPTLLERVRPVHEVVPVDVFIQGCPPSAELIKFMLNELLEGRLPGRGVRTRFG